MGTTLHTLRTVDDVANVVRERMPDVYRPPAGAYDVGTFLFHGLTPLVIPLILGRWRHSNPAALVQVP